MDAPTMGKFEKEQNILLSWNSINDNYNNGFASIDSSWNVTYLNKAAKKILGIDVLPQNSSFWKVFNMMIPSRIESRCNNASTDSLPNVFVHYWKPAEAWYIFRSYYSNNELSIYFRSSEFSQEAETRSSTMKQLYQFITEISNECLWDWNLETKEIFWVDGGHKKLFGYNMENIWLPQSFCENRIHPDDRRSIKNKLSELAVPGGDEIWECEYRFQRSDGEYSYVSEHGHVFFDSTGKACRILGATQDETLRYQSEKTLEETKRNLSLIIEETTNAVIITDSEGKINYVNKAFSKSTGYGTHEVFGRKPGEVLQGINTNQVTVEYIRFMIKENLPFDCEILNYTKEGVELWIRIQAQPFNDATKSNGSYFSIQTDITEQTIINRKAVQEIKQNQLAITDAVLKALEKERNEIGKEIHDNLNHTLVASKLYIDLAKSDDKSRDMYLEKSSEYIAYVIESIRKISKMLVTPDLMGLMVSVETLLDDLKLAHPIKFSFLKGPLNEDELADSLKLNIFRIVQEQLINIIKHSQAKKATIKIFKVDETIVVTITDNGVGYDLSSKRKGVGLRNIHSRAALFDGIVDLKSKPGHGFQLEVTLKLLSKS